MAYKLYICSTYYHVLIAIVKSMQDNIQNKLILTSYIPKADCLAARIEAFHIFEEIEVIKEIKEYVPSNKLDELLFFHKKNKQYLKAQLSWEQKLRNALEINIFHDDTWISHYLKEFAIPYTLLEDALDSFTVIDQSPFAYMLPSKKVKHQIKKMLNIGYFFLQESPYIKRIEVNSLNNLKIPIDKRVSVTSRKKLFEHLTAKQKRILTDIFWVGGNPLDFFKKSSLLLLTQPLYEDGLINSFEEQKNIYLQIIKQFKCCNETIYIKPHPRDSCDYRDFNVELLDRFFPIEILNYLDGIHFKRVITIFSTAIHSVEIADEKICITLDELKKLKEEVQNDGHV